MNEELEVELGTFSRSLSGGATTRRLLGTSTLLFVLVALLVACSSHPEVSDRNRPPSAGLPVPAYLLTIDLGSSGDYGRDQVEEATGGRVLVWRGGEYAIVGLDRKQAAAEWGDAGLQVLGADEVEENEPSFEAGATAWMSGTSKVWAGGTSKVWAGGTSKVWAGGGSELWEDGSYSWMPENDAAWDQIHLQEGHDLAPALGNGVKVAIIDTGVDLEHPALMEALAPPEEWWDFHDDDPLPQEEGSLGEGGFGHGTNVAGIVRQIAPRASILPLRALGSDGSGRVSHVAAAIDWAVHQGADVINLSLGSIGASTAVEASIRSATDHGVLVVSSSGNTGDSAVTYPASSAASQDLGWRRLSVTSVDPQDNKSEFATFGEEVELAAPGEEVFGPLPDDRMAAWSGTSMAAPIAAGALALALAEPPKVPRGDLADELRHRAYHDIYNNRNEEYQHLLGRGRVDLVEFLRNVVDR